MLPEQQQRILGYFIEEAKDHLNTIEQGLLNLQATIVNPEMANEVFRAAHSVKGGAAMLGIESMQRTAHRMEDYFKLLKEAPVKVDRSLESMFLRVFDALQELLEQLQGPFGLTEDKENSIMTGVEPVFQQLQEHLDQLVADADSNEVLEEVSVAPVTIAPSSTQLVEESALKLVFSSDVSAALREMLAQFKQADTDESRLALESCCQTLERFGEQFNLPTWMNLVKHSRWAVCELNNDYRTLAPVLIREIKKAQDLVLAGREREITLSEELQALAATQGEEISTSSSIDDLFIDDSLFTSSEKRDTNDIIGINDLSTLEAKQTPDTVEVVIPATNPATDDDISIDDLLNDAATNPSGPEVGVAELTSLADLFEASGDDLDNDWQEEELPITDSKSSEESLDIDISPDFEDLLNDDSSEPGVNLNDFESGNELADLFGDTADESAHNTVTTASLEDIGSLESIFDDVVNTSSEAASDEVTITKNIFDNSEKQPPSEINADETLLNIADNLNEINESTALSETSNNDQTDIALAFDNVELTSDTENLLGESLDASSTIASDFFNESEGPSETLDDSGSEQSEFDDFFAVDEAFIESSTETLSASLDDDLWTEGDSSDSSTVEPSLDDLSADIWDSNPQQTISTDTLAKKNIPTQNKADSNLDELELDDVWASIEDVDLDLATESTQIESEITSKESPEEEINLLFEDINPALDTELEQVQSEDFFSEDGLDNLLEEDSKISELSQSEANASSLNEGLDALFSDDTNDTDENVLELNDSPFEVKPELTELESGLESLELAEEQTAVANIPDLDIELSNLNLTNSSNEDDLEFLSDPPSNDLDFDLLDLEDGGVVTGFITDEHDLDIGSETDPVDNSDINPFSDTRADEVPPDINILETGLDELGLGDSNNKLEEVSDVDFTMTEDLFEVSNVTSSEDFSEQSLDSLDSLLSESSEEVNEITAHEAPGISETDTSHDLGNLQALLDDSEESISSDKQSLDSLDSLLSESSEEISEITTHETPDISETDISHDFDDLEALLDTPKDSVSPTTTVNSLSSSSGDDEFGDLEALLQDADKKLTPTVTSTTSYRPPSNRLSSRRTVTDQTMRVSVSHLDNLSNLVGELVVNRNTLEQDQERLRQFLDNLLFQVQQLNDVGQRMRDLYERSLLESSLISSRQSYQIATSGTPTEIDVSDHATGESFDALEMDRFTGFHTLSQEMIELIVRVRESASDIAYTVESSDQVTRQFRQVTNQLQEGLNKARMVPFAQTASRLPRAVRDISVKCGKEARLIVEGRDILIDKMILEQLYDPMTHLVNNAITHGVETPEERRLSGKPPEGVITVRAFYQGNQTVISVGDDGAGIDPDIVKRKALQKGLISQADVQAMTVLDVYDLLFHPGFSTRDQADDFAGRGFGMDVVRTSLADIRGNITIDSEPGRGTNFTIRLPLTLSISKALSCISNQARIAFPMDGVEDMFDVSRERIQKNDQEQDCILWRDTLLPFQNLSDLLSFNRTLGRGRVYGGNQDENMISIVVLRSTNSFIALEVDQVMGEQEIVIKQLEGPVPKPTGIAGATVLGDGRVMPIADVLELIDLALGRVRREPSATVWSQLEESSLQEEPAKVKSEPTVLIVDDSITVRELLSMSFNKVGYRVEQARDGQEAWEKLRSGLPCDLVFCDIEMPRMDGLELLSRLQKDGELQQVPIAMLTSRGADRHRQMAVDLGASGYFTKPYLEEALLDAANKMLHGEKLV
ncbi:MAG: response regulator [Leptolyngbya sp. SIO3F4]|nr:response regulator [Leptolyngbya sp. SIO3F4]